jgi:drug/metabolite transporter (DMT)-like permease
MTRRGWLLFGSMCLIWGIPYLLIKVGVGGLHPATLVFFRTVLSSLLLVPLVVLRGYVTLLLASWRTILAYSAIEVAIPWFLLADAEQRLSSSTTGLLVATSPLFAAVLAILMRDQDRIGLRRLIGLGLGFAGVAALVGIDVSTRDLGAALEVVGVALCYATGPMIIARRLSHVPAMGAVAASMVLTAVAYAPLALTRMPATLPSADVLAAVAILGVICTVLAFLIFFALIAEAGPVRATVITYVNPAVALALGVAILHERFTLGAGIGFGLILIGSVLSTGRRPKPVASEVAALEAPSPETQLGRP